MISAFTSRKPSAIDDNIEDEDSNSYIDVIDTVGISADLSAAYLDYESITANIEVIVVGRVIELIPTVNDMGRIYSFAAVDAGCTKR